MLGIGEFGQLGYGNTNTIGDDETPDTVGVVNLGQTASAITAGGSHTCAILADNTVKCWGRGNNGQLGYGNIDNIGDNETPNTVGVVNLGQTAKAITAGGSSQFGGGHTCALLADNTVKCWGFGRFGRLGYGK